jgi:hypothetical protein
MLHAQGFSTVIAGLDPAMHAENLLDQSPRRLVRRMSPPNLSTGVPSNVPVQAGADVPRLHWRPPIYRYLYTMASGAMLPAALGKPAMEVAMRTNRTILVFLLVAFAVPISDARADDPKAAPTEQCTAQNQQICNIQLVQCRRSCLGGQVPCSPSCCVRLVACLRNYSCSTQGYDCQFD